MGAVYAAGVTSVDNILCHLSISTRLSEVERDKVVPLILEGYREAATEAGSSVSEVTGGCASAASQERTSLGLQLQFCQSSQTPLYPEIVC